MPPAESQGSFGAPAGKRAFRPQTNQRRSWSHGGRGYSSLFSLRRPQCGSLCFGLNSRTWWRFNACMTPMRANIVGPPCVVYGKGQPLYLAGFTTLNTLALGSGPLSSDHLQTPRTST
jgi:hypothetical protein